MLIKKLSDMIEKDMPRNLIAYLENFFEDKEIEWLKEKEIVIKVLNYYIFDFQKAYTYFNENIPLRGEQIKEPMQVKGVKPKDDEKYTIDDIKDLFNFFSDRLGLDIDDTEPDDEDEIDEDEDEDEDEIDENEEALQLCRSMLENKDCGLTFLQLWGLIDDILLKNISFDDSGIHFYDLLKLVDRYSNQ